MFNNLFDRRGLSVDRLRALVDVAQAGGIVKAVGSDPVRQSLYSRQIKELDQFFGVELTCLKGRTLALTDAGNKVASAARSFFVSISDIRKELADQPVDICVGAGEATLHWLITDLTGLIQKGFPNTIFTLVNLKTSAVTEALMNRTIDFGVVRSTAVTKSLESIKVGFLNYNLFVPKCLIKKNQPKDTINLLHQIPLAVLEGDGDYSKQILAVGERLNKPLHIALKCTSLPQISHAIRSGNYAGILPHLACPDLPSDNFLALELKELSLFRRQLSLCWHPRLFSTRDNMEKLSTYIAEVIQKKLQFKHFN
jgi:DNA-binding transcriptional LysR family regulator